MTGPVQSIRVGPCPGIDAVVLEPWGEIFALDPGRTLEVVCSGAAGGQIEVTIDEQDGQRFLKFWAPEGGRLDGRRLPPAA